MKKNKYNYAFTLVEIMIAMSLLCVFGLLLVQVLRNTMQSWSYAEKQRQLYETAWNITHILKEDMESIYSIDAPSQETTLQIDFDSNQKQRLRLVRRIEEKKHAVLRNSGSEPSENGYGEFYFSSQDAKKKLKASGGLAEIVYMGSCEKNSQQLWRGFKTPIGGKESFFLSHNIDTDEKIKKSCQLLSSDVLYFRIQCWGEKTRHWDSKEGHAFFVWDSISNALPVKVQCILSIRGDHCPVAFLAQEIGEKEETILLKSMQNFPIPPGLYQNYARIGEEWVSFEKSKENQLSSVKRGILNTVASAHKENTPIYWGVFFTITIYLPCHYRT